MSSEYLPMFLAEAREALQELNLAVLRLEEAPDDSSASEQIFRIAHTLKGMSGTMGFDQIAQLTHNMEDVFELLRQRRGALGRVVIDTVFECLDALEGAIDTIDENGVDTLDPSALIARLQGLVRKRRDDQARQQLDEFVPDPKMLLERAGGRPIVRARAVLSPDAGVPSVRAFMVLGRLQQVGDVIASKPAEDEVDAFSGRDILAWVATDTRPDQVAAAMHEVTDVISVEAAVLPAPGGDAAVPAKVTVGQRIESPLAARGKAAKGTSSVRVDVERLDQLMHLMGELVVDRTRLEALVAGSQIPGAGQALQSLARSSQALQEMVMRVRMIPVEAVLMRFPRLVRDLSAKLGKHVELELVGKQTELDRTVVDMIGEPLVHLVRNALDHGLETPEERAAAGKPEEGHLQISARHSGGAVVISVQDDGRGIDAGRVARKAVERGLVAPEGVGLVDTAKAIELLFTPGFTTADELTDVSGRGVGMDAVRSAIRALGGEVTVTSEPGTGTQAEIRLPLTLAILSALVVEIGDGWFAIPLERIERTLALDDVPIRSVAGRRMLMLDDASVPLLDASHGLGGKPTGTEEFAVIVEGPDRRVAIAVDALDGQQELVTRPLPPQTAGLMAASGAAVLPSGQIALIVDPISLVPEPAAALSIAA